MPGRASVRDQYAQWEQLAVDTTTRLWAAPSAQAGAITVLTSATFDPSCAQGTVNQGLAVDQIPAQYVDILIQAGNTCPEIPPAQLAGIIQQESSWNPNATSGSPARGLTQFIDSTWASYGVDSKLDKAGKPESSHTPPDPYNPYDSILAEANYQCTLAKTLKPMIDSGQLHGDLLDLVSAAYNAGEGAVIAYGGIPPYAQTMDYVPKVRANRERFTAPAGGLAAGPSTLAVHGGSAFGRKVVEAALSQSGLPYVWGGGDAHGPSPGSGGGEAGFDCSGLVEYAVATASEGRVNPGGVTTEQVTHGTPVRVQDIQPGDAVFSANTGHVSIWAGDGKVVEASDFGIPVGVHNFDLSNAEDIRRYG